MKKILSGLLLTILLVTTFLCPLLVSADSDDWVLGPDAAYITHGDKTYYPMEFSNGWYFNYNDVWESYPLELEDERDKQKYEGAYVDVMPKMADKMVEVYFIHGNHDFLFYVEKSYRDEFLRIQQGESSVYSTSNYYDSVSVMLSKEEYQQWLQGEVVEMTALDVENYEYHDIYSCDSHDVFRQNSGLVLRDAATDALYLLDYRDYDRTYFYADGIFATDHDGAVKVYMLEDETLRKELIQCYDTLPEEDLDWLVPYEPSESTTIVVSIIFFGVLPGAIMVFSVVMLIVVKKRQYRIPFIILLCSAATVLIAFILLSGYVTLDPLSINYSPLLF